MVFLFQVLLNDASKVLYKAFDGRLFYKEVTLVVPNSWRDEKCKAQVQVPAGATTFGVSDFLEKLQFVVVS